MAECGDGKDDGKDDGMGWDGLEMEGIGDEHGMEMVGGEKRG